MYQAVMLQCSKVVTVISNSLFKDNQNGLTSTAGEKWISNTVFVGNSFAVMLSFYGTSHFDNCTFRGNNGRLIYQGTFTGSLFISNSLFVDNIGNSQAIIFTVSIVVDSSIFINNTNVLPIQESLLNGGAICINHFGVITNSLFVNNTSSGFGGAIYAAQHAVINNCTFIGNSATLGGAIYAQDTTNITRSTFINNQANEGRAIYFINEREYEAVLTIDNTSFEREVMAEDYSSSGSATIYCNFGTLQLNNTTFQQNVVSGYFINSQVHCTATISDSNFIDNRPNGNALMQLILIYSNNDITIQNSVFRNTSYGYYTGLYNVDPPAHVIPVVRISNSSFSGGSITSIQPTHTTISGCYFNSSFCYFTRQILISDSQFANSDINFIPFQGRSSYSLDAEEDAGDDLDLNVDWENAGLVINNTQFFSCAIYFKMKTATILSQSIIDRCLIDMEQSNVFINNSQIYTSNVSRSYPLIKKKNEFNIFFKATVFYLRESNLLVYDTNYCNSQQESVVFNCTDLTSLIQVHCFILFRFILSVVNNEHISREIL